MRSAFIGEHLLISLVNFYLSLDDEIEVHLERPSMETTRVFELYSSVDLIKTLSVSFLHFNKNCILTP